MSRIEKMEEDLESQAIEEINRLIGENSWGLGPSLNSLSWDVSMDGSVMGTGDTRLMALKNTLESLREKTDEEYEIVDHPQHYGGIGAKHEAISVIEEWNLGFHLGNVVKYISRAGRKPDQTQLDDLRKAQWYLERFIEKVEENT